MRLSSSSSVIAAVVVVGVVSVFPPNYSIAFQPPLSSSSSAPPNNNDVRLPGNRQQTSLFSENQRQPNSSSDKPITTSRSLSSWKDVASAAFVAGIILATPLELDVVSSSSSPTTSSSPVISVNIQPSKANALTEEQLLVTDVWKEVTKQYLDTTYNGMGEDKWKAKRLDAVKKVTSFGPDEEDKVYDVIRDMLSALGDPYTRFLTPDQYDALANYARGGTSAGVGVQLQVDPKTGSVVVLGLSSDTCPAAKGGIKPGDAIVEVDGMDMSKATAELVAAKCRGDVGTNVNVAVRHANDKKVTYLTLQRDTIQVNPVQIDTATIKGKKYGIITLSSFNQETTKQIVDAIRQLQQKAPGGGLVIDLRGNAGGYMPAGVDVAKLFLKPQARIITQVDKSDRQIVEIADGIGSETTTPLYIVVDERTASASEIMTAALQDNNRATVIGATTKTFGKGRIQNVQEVAGGGSGSCGIAVTKAKYITPNGKDIHGVGITPNIISNMCGAGPDNTIEDCLSSVL